MSECLLGCWSLLFIYLLCHIYPGVPHQCAALFSLGLLHYMHDKTNINQHTFSYNNFLSILNLWHTRLSIQYSAHSLLMFYALCVQVLHDRTDSATSAKFRLAEAPPTKGWLRTTERRHVHVHVHQCDWSEGAPTTGRTNRHSVRQT